METMKKLQVVLALVLAAAPVIYAACPDPNHVPCPSGYSLTDTGSDDIWSCCYQDNLCTNGYPKRGWLTAEIYSYTDGLGVGHLCSGAPMGPHFVVKDCCGP